MTHQNSRLLALGAMIIMLILYFLTYFGWMGDNPVGQTPTYENPLIVPAPYAFSIWSIIYTGLIAFPIYQLVKKKQDHDLWKSVRIWYALNVIGNGLWLVLASYNWLWMSLAIITFMLVSLYKINALLIRIKAEGGEVNFWGERLVFSLYFAWITLATALNVSAALSFYQWDGFGISDLTWAIIILPIIALIATAVVLKYKDIGYAAVVIWAFIALVVKHWEAYPILAYISIGVIIWFTGLMVLSGKKKAKSLV